MSCLQLWDPACCKPARWGSSYPAHSLPSCLGVLEVRRRTRGFSGLPMPGGGRGRWRQDMHTDQPRKSLPRIASSADSNQANSCHPLAASRVLVSQSLTERRQPGCSVSVCLHKTGDNDFYLMNFKLGGGRKQQQLRSMVTGRRGNEVSATLETGAV